MSGPIVRKYGFPNFEQIFGKRDLEHGQDEPGASGEATKGSPGDEGKAEEAAPKASGQAPPKS